MIIADDLRDEISTKTHEVWGSGSFQIGEHIHVRGEWRMDSAGTEAPAFGTITDPAFCIYSFVSYMYMNTYKVFFVTNQQ